MENIVDGFVGNEEGGFDFKALTRKWKPIAIVIFGLLIVGLLAYTALNVVQASPVSMEFEEKIISAGDSTILKVFVVNTGEIDAHDVNITITPESEVLTITNPSRIESVIGSKSKRMFEFEVTVLDATPGTYKVTAKATNLLAEEEFASAYLEIE